MGNHRTTKQQMHHLLNKLGNHHNHASPNGNIAPKLDLRKAGYGFVEITLERDMDSIRATVGDVFISYTKEKKPDPYVMLIIGGDRRETTYRKNTKQAFFGESFVFHCHPESVMDVYVVDKDWGRDDLMFNGSIPLGQLPQGRKVTVHVRREAGGSTNGYNVHEGCPQLVADVSPIYVPPNPYAAHTPIFTHTVDDVFLYVYDTVALPPTPAFVDVPGPADVVGPPHPVLGPGIF